MDLHSIGGRLRAYLFIAGSILASHVAVAQTASLQQGSAWLQAQVESDGSLQRESDSVATPYQVREESLVALGLFDDVPTQLAGNVTGGSPGNTEYIARRILAGVSLQLPVTDLSTNLVAMQHDDGGWGLVDTYASDPLDTALALQALRAAGYLPSDSAGAVADYLNLSMNSDGGWGINGRSSLYVTTRVVLATSGSSIPGMTDIESSANAWLLGMRTASNDFGDTFENSNGLLALSKQASNGQARAPLVSALEASQLSDGSWGQDPYLTALALQALYSASLPSPDQISLRGHVIDGQTGALFSGVSVQLAGEQLFTSETNAEGNFDFQDILKGAYTLTLSHDGYRTVTTTISLGAGDALDLGTIALLPETSPGGSTTSTVKGIVTDAATGAPIDGASVLANGTAATTASDGTYEIAGLAPGAVTIEASAPGYQSATGTGTLIAGGITLFSPQLSVGDAGGTPSSTLHGVVTDVTSGNPIANASVSVSGANTASTLTDAAGSYALDGLSAGIVEIDVSASGYDSANVSTQLPGNTTVEFSPTLFAAGTAPDDANTEGVSGKVVDSTTNQPLGGVTIDATSPDGTTQQTTTDASGDFEVAGLSQATVTLSFTLANYASAQFSAWPEPLKTTDIGQVRLRPDGVLQLLPDLRVVRVDSKVQAHPTRKRSF